MPRTHPEIRELLEAAVSELRLALSERQLEQLTTYFTLLLRWNQKINLTALRRSEEIATRHFEESLFLLQVVPCETGLLVDVGSGAGFPGLPVKIACPSLAAVLLEPNKKKSAFLKEVVRHCGLESVKVRTERLEEAARGDLGGKATLVTVRAVKPTRELLAGLKRFVAPEGHLALFLGANDATVLATTPGFQWAPPAPIPYSDRRVILVGRAT